jgi:hypothetical protein
MHGWCVGMLACLYRASWCSLPAMMNNTACYYYYQCNTQTNGNPPSGTLVSLKHLSLFCIPFFVLHTITLICFGDYQAVVPHSPGGRQGVLSCMVKLISPARLLQRYQFDSGYPGTPYGTYRGRVHKIDRDREERVRSASRSNASHLHV